MSLDAPSYSILPVSAPMPLAASSSAPAPSVASVAPAPSSLSLLPLVDVPLPMIPLPFSAPSPATSPRAALSAHDWSQSQSSVVPSPLAAALDGPFASKAIAPQPSRSIVSASSSASATAADLLSPSSAADDFFNQPLEELESSVAATHTPHPRIVPSHTPLPVSASLSASSSSMSVCRSTPQQVVWM
jgi:hypothetical protein